MALLTDRQGAGGRDPAELPKVRANALRVRLHIAFPNP